MKKTLIVLFALLFSLQTVSAFAGTNGLKEIMDEMNFELSQADSAGSYQKIGYDYSVKIKGIMDSLSAEERIVLRNELIALAGPKVKKEVEHLMTVIDFEKLSQEEQAHLIASIMQKNSTQGTAWVGEVGAGVGIVVILLFMTNAWVCGALFDEWFGWVWWKDGCGG